MTIVPTQSEDDRVRQYLSLVNMIVSQMAANMPEHVDFQDLYSAGLRGLLTALRRFIPGRGVPFESYAGLRIRGAMRDDLRRKDWVPRGIRQKTRKVNAVIEGLEQEKGRAVLDKEVATVLKISVGEYQSWKVEIEPVEFVRMDAVKPDSFSDDQGQYGDIPDPSQEDPGEVVARKEMTELAVKRIERLADPQKTVMSLYYLKDMRLHDIGKLFGLSDCRILQIRTEALRKIKIYLTSRLAITPPAALAA